MGIAALLWGLSGFVLLLLVALWRLTPITLDAFAYQWVWYHWLVFAINLFFMAYSEGYRGFQKAFSPRFAARARFLMNNTTWLRFVAAPLFCMGFFHAPKRRVITAWVLTIMIIVLVVIFHKLPQPWRGLLDAGVLLGLSWGLIATVVISFQALTAVEFPHSPEVLV